MNRFLEFLRSIGPAIIVAAVVCGPGSMLMSSKTGAIYGYQMIWVLVLAAILMWSMVVLSARLGVVHEHTLLQELANRLGRPVAALVGIFLFLVVAGFQVSNNVAILAAIEPFLEKEGSTAPALEGRVALQIGILVFLNVFVIAVIYRFGNLYKPVERLLKGIVLLVVVCFAINLFLAKPDLGA
ncbi:MAG: divalent metal cation transporter, partial [Verrucomicrobiae bacterium]|nr:divalent metal cation transporter [Verrucomicrobiae bacterium]